MSSSTSHLASAKGYDLNPLEYGGLRTSGNVPQVGKTGNVKSYTFNKVCLKDSGVGKSSRIMISDHHLSEFDKELEHINWDINANKTCFVSELFRNETKHRGLLIHKRLKHLISKFSTFSERDYITIKPNTRYSL